MAITTQKGWRGRPRPSEAPCGRSRHSPGLPLISLCSVPSIISWPSEISPFFSITSWDRSVISSKVADVLLPPFRPDPLIARTSMRAKGSGLGDGQTLNPESYVLESADVLALNADSLAPSIRQPLPSPILSPTKLPSARLDDGAMGQNGMSLIRKDIPAWVVDFCWVSRPSSQHSQYRLA